MRFHGGHKHKSELTAGCAADKSKLLRCPFFLLLLLSFTPFGQRFRRLPFRGFYTAPRCNYHTLKVFIIIIPHQSRQKGTLTQTPRNNIPRNKRGWRQQQQKKKHLLALGWFCKTCFPACFVCSLFMRIFAQPKGKLVCPGQWQLWSETRWRL